MTQLDLFAQTGESPEAGEHAQPVATLPTELTAESTLTSALGPYQTYLRDRGMSEHTLKAFVGDARLLTRYFRERDEQPALKDVGTDDLNQFLYWLRYERVDDEGDLVPCSPKSYSRRITSIKSFFGWLYEIGLLAKDPAAPVLQESARAPLPRALFDTEVDRLLRTARDLLWSPTKPDARPYLIILIVLQTGIKKNELMNVRLDDIDDSNPREPELTVRYLDAKHSHKERKLALGPAVLPVLNQYRRAYKPEERLFPCTARNLEYVLEDVGNLADLPVHLSFEMLRWTSAVRAYRFGTSPETLRKKLGLSPVAWRETFEKIKVLASPGL